MDLSKERSVDLILLDQKASGLDRMATLRAIRESDPTVPVYVMTGFEIEFRDRFRQMKQEGIFSSCRTSLCKRPNWPWPAPWRASICDHWKKMQN